MASGRACREYEKGRLRSGGLLYDWKTFEHELAHTDKNFPIVELSFKYPLNGNAASESDGTQHPKTSPP